jgi:N4-gp56 family major capsid protein
MLTAGNATTTSSLRHLATVYYKKTALDNCMKRFYFQSAGMPDILPERSGKTVQFFRYTLLGSNTTPSAEAVSSPGIQMDSTTISATVSEYSDHLTGSKLLQKTAIDPIAEGFSKHLGYRAGLSVDTICRIELDSAVSSVTVATSGPAGSSSDLRRTKALMEGVDVRPRTDTDDFMAIIHPYVLYDIASDNTNGGFIDVMKYANPKETFIQGEVGKVEGCRLVKSTNVGTDGTAAPLTKYYTYVIGEGAFGVVSLAGGAPSKVTDPEKQMFQVNVVQGKVSEANPEGKIGFLVSYWFAFVAKLLDSNPYRYRIIPMDASII